MRCLALLLATLSMSVHASVRDCSDGASTSIKWESLKQSRNGAMLSVLGEGHAVRGIRAGGETKVDATFDDCNLRDEPSPSPPKRDCYLRGPAVPHDSRGACNSEDECHGASLHTHRSLRRQDLCKRYVRRLSWPLQPHHLN